MKGGRNTTAALIALLQSGASLAGPAPDVNVVRPAGRRIILVAAWTTCDRKPDDALAGPLRREMDDLSEVLRRKDPRLDVQVLQNPARLALKQALGAGDGPLFVLYSGHGTLGPGGSQLCLADRNVPAEEVITFPGKGTPYATFLFNACKSSEVHVRRPNTVVISAGPNPIENRHLETELGAELLEALKNRPLDVGGDGFVDSGDLFRVLDRAHVGEWPIEVKMQSQAWTPLPLLEEDVPAKTLGSSWTSGQVRVAEREQAYRAGNWAPAIDEPPVLWFVPPEIDASVAAPAASTRSDGPSGDRIETAAEARAIAVATLATLVIGLSREHGRLIARNRRTGEVVWERAARTDERLSAGDRQEIVWGYEQKEPTTRRYRRPLRAVEEEVLEREGWRPRHCAQSTGQCFARAPRASTLPGGGVRP